MKRGILATILVLGAGLAATGQGDPLARAQQLWLAYEVSGHGTIQDPAERHVVLDFGIDWSVLSKEQTPVSGLPVWTMTLRHEPTQLTVYIYRTDGADFGLQDTGVPGWERSLSPFLAPGGGPFVFGVLDPGIFAPDGLVRVTWDLGDFQAPESFGPVSPEFAPADRDELTAETVAVSGPESVASGFVEFGDAVLPGVFSSTTVWAQRATPILEVKTGAGFGAEPNSAYLDNIVFSFAPMNPDGTVGRATNAPETDFGGGNPGELGYSGGYGGEGAPQVALTLDDVGPPTVLTGTVTAGTATDYFWNLDGVWMPNETATVSWILAPGEHAVTFVAGNGASLSFPAVAKFTVSALPAEVTFTVSGRITSVPGALSHWFEVGSSYEVTYVIDPNAPDGTGDPKVGTYLALEGRFSIGMSDGTAYEASTADTLQVSVLDGASGPADELLMLFSWSDAADLVRGPKTLRFQEVAASLADSTGAAFPDDSVPLLLDLAAFDGSGLSFAFEDPQGTSSESDWHLLCSIDAIDGGYTGPDGGGSPGLHYYLTGTQNDYEPLPLEVGTTGRFDVAAVFSDAQGAVSLQAEIPDTATFESTSAFPDEAARSTFSWMPAPSDVGETHRLIFLLKDADGNLLAAKVVNLPVIASDGAPLVQVLGGEGAPLAGDEAVLSWPAKKPMTFMVRAVSQNGGLPIVTLTGKAGTSGGDVVLGPDTSPSLGNPAGLGTAVASAPLVWVPGAADEGTVTLSFTAEDEEGLSTTFTLVLEISLDGDEDGLPDGWETSGYDHDGVHVPLPRICAELRDLHGPGSVLQFENPGDPTIVDPQEGRGTVGEGARPARRDLFIEVDWVEGTEVNPHALLLVAESFARAAVTSNPGDPGGTPPTGIAVHIFVSNEVTQADFGPGSGVDLSNGVGNDPGPGRIYDWREFDAIKAQNLTPGFAPAFHYCLLVPALGGGTETGISRDAPAADYIIALGSTVLLDQQAGTFMHELGHNLGLRHGGDEDINYKPNYLSVMNYSFQFGLDIYNKTTGKWNDPVDDYRRFNYSTLVLPDLDETNLDEALGLDLPAEWPFTTLNGYATKWFWMLTARLWPGTSAEPDAVYGNVVDTDGDGDKDVYDGIDWNGNGVAEVLTEADVNRDSDPRQSGFPPRTVYFSGPLRGYADWPNLLFHGGQIGAAGSSLPQGIFTPTTEQTQEDAEAHSPPPSGTNTPPVAVAKVSTGATLPVGVPVTLDASDSWDADGDKLFYSWYEGETPLGTGETLTLVLGHGEHVIQLLAWDRRVYSDPASLAITMNTPPVAVADTSTGARVFRWGVPVTLDASGSSDADGDELQYFWSEGDTSLGTGELLTVSNFSPGTHVIQLLAKDQWSTSAPAILTISIDAPPVVSSVKATPSYYWPPNGKFFKVKVTVVSSDDFDPSPKSQITQVESNEPVSPGGDWVITGDLTVSLRSDRDNVEPARCYTLTIVTTDSVGNSTTSYAYVYIDHDQSVKTTTASSGGSTSATDATRSSATGAADGSTGSGGSTETDGSTTGTGTPQEDATPPDTGSAPQVPGTVDGASRTNPVSREPSVSDSPTTETPVDSTSGGDSTSLSDDSAGSPPTSSGNSGTDGTSGGSGSAKPPTTPSGPTEGLEGGAATGAGATEGGTKPQGAGNEGPKQTETLELVK